MSWQTYVDVNLLGTGFFSDAAILGQAGGSWASSSNFQISPQEQSTLTQAYDDPSGLQANGIHLGCIYGRKGGAGCVCVKTKQAIIVAIYKAGTQPGEATKCTETLADYLISTGF
ncbi:profilin [Melampsora americana]|nr:profilin [Melampsora americana]